MEKPIVSDVYVYGILGIAEELGMSIPEVVLDGVVQVIDIGRVDELPSLIRAAEFLSPGSIYAIGLRVKTGLNEILRERTEEAIEKLRSNSQEDQIPVTRKAFTWLTGETL